MILYRNDTNLPSIFLYHDTPEFQITAYACLFIFIFLPVYTHSIWVYLLNQTYVWCQLTPLLEPVWSRLASGTRVISPKMHNKLFWREDLEFWLSLCFFFFFKLDWLPLKLYVILINIIPKGFWYPALYSDDTLCYYSSLHCRVHFEMCYSDLLCYMSLFY